jgi:hypothetical protein
MSIVIMGNLISLIGIALSIIFSIRYILVMRRMVPRLKQKFQVLCADHSVSQIISTHNSRAEAMKSIKQWAQKDHTFTVREVWTV